MIAADIVCNVCEYTAECWYAEQPMCYVCRERRAKAEKETEDINVECDCNGDKACEACAEDLYGPSEGDEYNGGYDDEPAGPNDYSDDAEALASAGMGTDENYGYYGGEE